MKQDVASIAQKARSQMTASGHFELKRISCAYDGEHGVLTLRGCVSSFYMKQLAQSLAANLPQVRQVVNQLEVAEKCPIAVDATPRPGSAARGDTKIE